MDLKYNPLSARLSSLQKTDPNKNKVAEIFNIFKISQKRCKGNIWIYYFYEKRLIYYQLAIQIASEIVCV
tara:strand:- start:180 stop:389 length:210 start_codon:yes stop_codon:yes gene_type:complete